MVARHRVHHRRRQRRHADGHAEAEHHHGRKERRPVGTADAGPAEQGEAQCRDKRPDNQWRPCPIALDEPAGPARQEEHQHDERQESGAGGGGRVSLDLDQVHRKEEEDAAERGIQKKGERLAPLKLRDRNKVSGSIGVAERNSTTRKPASRAMPATAGIRTDSISPNTRRRDRRLPAQRPASRAGPPGARPASRGRARS